MSVTGFVFGCRGRGCDRRVCLYRLLPWHRLAEARAADARLAERLALPAGRPAIPGVVAGEADKVSSSGGESRFSTPHTRLSRLPRSGC